MQRILVTGGAGFLGSHLCETLVRHGHSVTCLDNYYTGSPTNIEHLIGEDFEIVEHDIVRPYYADVDAIYHLACPASPVHYQRDPVRTLKTAFRGTLNVLELARRCGARVLLASTSEIYGDPLVHPQPERYWGNVNPIGERACYDEGKRSAEALAVAFARRDGLDVRIARIFNTYGPRMDRNDGRVVSNFIIQALSGQPITLYGDGRQTRSFCYVGDMIEALVRLMTVNHHPGPVNLGNPEEITIAALAQLILELSESPSVIVRRPLPSDDPSRRRPDIQKARAVLGWSPRVPVREGLQLTIADFSERLRRSTAVPFTQRAS